MSELIGRKSVNETLKNIWKEIDRLSEEYIRTGRHDLYVTMEGLKKQSIRIMEIQKRKEEAEEHRPETEAEYADRKFDEEIEFLSKYGNLDVTNK